MGLQTRKVCTRCNLEKEIGEFSPRSDRGENSYRSNCKSCTNKYTKEYAASNKATAANAYLFRKYGITLVDYFKLLLEQKGRCAICKTHSPGNGRSGVRSYFAVDHDHNTGEIRGLLCQSCNQGLGRFFDNIDYLKSAIEYLEARKS